MPNIYLDNAATTFESEEVIAEETLYKSKKYGNPSSPHALGQNAKDALDDARRRIAYLIGDVWYKDIIFTSGGTEANNLALLSYMRDPYNRSRLTGPGKGHIITSVIEHKAVLMTCQELEKEGYRVTYLPVDRNGIVNPNDVKRAIASDTILITIMAANNEVGSIQPLSEISKIAKKHNIHFHTDAVQACGHLPINANELGIQMLSASGHKMNGPKGIGFLYAKNSISLAPIMYGGSQEGGRRPSTENVPAIMGMALAFENAVKNLKVNNQRYQVLRQQFLQIVSPSKRIIVNGSLDHTMDHFLNIQLRGCHNSDTIPYLNDHGIYVTGKSACEMSGSESSRTLTAMGIHPYEADCSLRITMGPEAAEEEIVTSANMILKYVNRN